METFEQKALDYYGEVIINKHLIHEAGFGARAIPTSLTKGAPRASPLKI